MPVYLNAMSKEQSYHHGDLRAVLLREAEAELADKGVEKFSLRGVAKRAGVSHAAPAHHFGDVKGLLTALAAEGFRRMMAMKQARAADAPPDQTSQFIASGLGYVDFALAHTALFRLMFSSIAVNNDDPDYAREGQSVFMNLADNVTALSGASPFDDSAARLNLIAAWSMVHGLAELMAKGRPLLLFEMTPEERDDALREIIGRTIPNRET